MRRPCTYTLAEDQAFTGSGPAVYSLLVVSSAGDSIGQGGIYSYSGASGTFQAVTNFGYAPSVVFTSSSNGGDFWDVNFAAPDHVRPTPGTYLNAAAIPVQPAGTPGLKVSGQGRAPSSITGQFTIYTATYNASGVPTSLAADFVQYANGAAAGLRGSVSYNDLRFSGVLANDTDVDSSNLSAILVAGPGHGTLGFNADGSFVYTPAPGYFGPDAFTYKANDGSVDSTVATVNLNVTYANDAPVRTAGSVAPLTVLEDAGSTSLGLGGVQYGPGGGLDEAGQTLTYNVTYLPSVSLGRIFLADGLTAVTTTSSYTLAQAQGMLFRANANASGFGTFNYTVTDIGTSNGVSDPKTLTEAIAITVTVVNDAPSFNIGAGTATNEDAGAASIAGWATNLSKGPPDEVGQSLSFQVSNDNASLFSSQPAIAADGRLTYAVRPDAFGAATVTVTLKDSGGVANGGVDTSAPQTFTITVNPVNDAPSFAVAANAYVDEDAGPQSIAGVVAAISAGPANEAGQALTFTVGNNNNSLFSVQPAVDPTTGLLTFTPGPNANGAATVTLSLKDNGGKTNGGADTSGTQTFTINVAPVDDAPSFVKGADVSVNEDAGLTTIAAWATQVSTGPANESAEIPTFIATYANSGQFATAPAIDPATGNLSFTPAPNFFGSVDVTVTLKDDGALGNGGVNTSPAQAFTITVSAVNDAPAVTGLSASPATLLSGASTTLTPWAWPTSTARWPVSPSTATPTTTASPRRASCSPPRPREGPTGAPRSPPRASRSAPRRSSPRPPTRAGPPATSCRPRSTSPARPRSPSRT
ncbi:MAG: Ig-like domain-containing protein [Planctomycetota bacterium]|nr:Ig-like domain-containing protein [Planctomycetota bacterium]